MRLHYLAYGSNLHPARLADRTPSARAEAVVELTGWRLAWHKRGRDGTGKANLVQTRGGVAHAVLYSLDDAEWPALVAAEGDGYRPARVRLDDHTPQAFSFFARASHIDERLQPFDWYRALVLCGARWHGFPDHALTALAAVTAQRDSDAGRAARFFALLDTPTETRKCVRSVLRCAAQISDE